MLFIQTEHTCIIYVQFIKGSKRKREIVQDRFRAFRLRKHFKHLKCDFSFSENVSNRRIR